jgi:hypothetical protein
MEREAKSALELALNYQYVCINNIKAIPLMLMKAT